jgi:tripartite-type tricarboxylate transporter receptor subunit TctC
VRNYFFLSLAVMCFTAGSSRAQSYPLKSVQIIIPYQAGSSVDVVFRILAPRLSDHLGQQTIVVNRPGGAATIGMNAVAKATPDGHTMGVATLSFATNPHFMTDQMPFNSEKDLTPVSLVTRTPLVLTVSAEVPVKTVKELITLARAKPDTLNYASAGIASSSHLAGALFASMSGIKITHVPFSTTGSGTGLAGGQTQIQITGIPSSLPNIKSGRSIALAVTTAKRVAALPGVPPLAEAGVPDFEMSEWAALLTPTGTPRAAIDRIYRDLLKTAADTEVRQRIENLAVQIVCSTPEELAGHLKKERVIWARMAAEVNAAEKKTVRLIP